MQTSLGLLPLPTTPVSFSGSVKLFTCNMDESAFVDFNDANNHQVFMYCWIDHERGAGTHVEFPTAGAWGKFNLTLPFRDQDPDLLKILCCMRMLDEESKNYRTITFASSAAEMNHLMQGTDQTFTMKDQMRETNYAEVTLRASNASAFGNNNTPMLTFSRSALWDVSLFNQEVVNASEAIRANFKKNSMAMPPGGFQFYTGLSGWEWGGADFEALGKGKLPALQTHYALMGAQEESLDRVLPMALVVYHLYLKIYHTGMSLAAILKLPDALFGQLFAQALQITCDAGLTPYERDFAPALALSFTRGLTLMASGTENMALPCGAPQYLGRVLRPLKPIQVKQGTPLTELHEIIKSNNFPELATGIIFDDCESTAQTAVLARKTCLTIPKSPTDLQKKLAGWEHLFGALTSNCWKGFAEIIDRGNNMLRSGYLTVTTSVGVATNASAAEVENDTASYNGHCFNVGCVQDSLMQVGSSMEGGKGSGSRASCFLLEGTSSMVHLRVDQHSPVFTLNVCRGPERNVFRAEEFDAANGCTMLTLWLRSATQIVNAPKGGQPPGGGWPTSNELTGWLGHLMVMHSLDSDPSTHLTFYSRIMYMGWPCTDEGLGCMPVEESAKALARGVAELPEKPKFFAGCHPYSLNDLDIRGVSADFSSDKRDLMKRIMNEAHPPMVDHSVLKQLSTYWAPCTPLEDVNVQAQAMREKGVEYIRLTAMETPSAPELVPVFYEAKRQLIRRTNQINMARPDSDGMIGSVERLGTGVHVFLDVPLRNTPVATFVESLKQALAELGWPGHVA